MGVQTTGLPLGLRDNIRYPFSTCLHHGAYELITTAEFRTINCYYLLNLYGDIFSLIYFIRACGMETGKPRAMHAIGRNMTY